jgi:NAD(P)-dependent dehydrogenase (short-subunit alcohol dehydrogenase family)
VTDAASVRSAVSSTVARFGRLDIVFSNAGIAGVIAPVAEYPEDDSTGCSPCTSAGPS